MRSEAYAPKSDDGGTELSVMLGAEPTEGDVTGGPLTVAFSAAVEGHEPANGGLTYTFYFGDGSHSGRLGAPNASHAYDKAGSYEAVVVVADESGRSAVSDSVLITTTTTVTVEPDDDELVARLTVSLNQTQAPATATFDASGSSAPLRISATRSGTRSRA